MLFSVILIFKCHKERDSQATCGGTKGEKAANQKGEWVLFAF